MTIRGPTNLMRYCTVQIEILEPESNRGFGTGFFFNWPTENEWSCPLLVTNKHVVANATVGRVRVHTSTLKDGVRIPSGASHGIEIHFFSEQWINHPEENVDLCAMPFGVVLHELRLDGVEVFANYLQREMIPTGKTLDELQAVEDILMVGYPRGLIDNTNNFPLIRKGITASHPAVDFEGKPEGVIDIACFPGSSGSPVFVINPGSYAAADDRPFWPNDRILFLGVLHAGPVLHATGEIAVANIPINVPKNFALNLMIHLGYYVKSRELIALAKEVVDQHKKLSAS